jgi:CheY-like chemotaxis protein
MTVSEGSPPTPPPPEGGDPRTVLVVDDNPDERAIQGAMLSHLGYRVAEASDGREAIERARAMHPDLILLDVAMPRMDGFAVCRALRANDQTRDIAILLFTASVVREVREQASAAGADDVLMKPVDPRTVAEKIGQLIGGPKRLEGGE